ncbi:hypothetical protein KKA27_01645 [Patescibacteria group bacterium]|nr:hypothetical protein [Patescibacteria group bacterium]MBU2633435.1 hypothetical protein [Patescibacteria group bacterium]
MMWQWWIVMVVVVIIVAARIYTNGQICRGVYKYKRSLFDSFCESKALEKVFGFMAFKSQLEPTEQAVHYFLGMTLVLPIAKYFALTGAGWYILIALACSVVKETADVVFTGHWDRRDSVVDTAFWMLGGLTTPLLRSFL